MEMDTSTPLEQAEIMRLIDAYERMEDDSLLMAALGVISDLFDGKPPDLRFNALAAVHARLTQH